MLSAGPRAVGAAAEARWLSGGRPPKHPRHELLNALAYWLWAGIAWRLLPHDFPPYQTVYHYWRQWRIGGRWEEILAALRARERHRPGP
jgi:transposase